MGTSLTQLHQNAPSLFCVGTTCAWLKKSIFYLLFLFLFVYDALPRVVIISIPYHNLIILLTAIFSSHLSSRLLSYTKCNKGAVYSAPSLIEYLKSCQKKKAASLCVTLFLVQISVLHNSLYKCQKKKKKSIAFECNNPNIYLCVSVMTKCEEN